MTEWPAMIDGYSCDREAAEEAICSKCGSTMRFDPRPTEERPGYEAWAVCTNEECGYEFEF